MKASEGRIGRVFVIRLEDGDIMPTCVERFAAEQGVRVGFALFVGGVNAGDVVSGPRFASARPLDPILVPVVDAHEVSAVGVLAPDAEGRPILHMHGALGRAGSAILGCIRPGVTTWLVGEVILYEILDVAAVRKKDPETGFLLLDVECAISPVVPPPPLPTPPPAPMVEKKETVAPVTEAKVIPLPSLVSVGATPEAVAPTPTKVVAPSITVSSQPPPQPCAKIIHLFKAWVN